MTTTIDTGAPAPLAHGGPVELILPLQPRRQSRLSILLRPAIAAPFALVAVLFAAAAAVVGVISWFAALVSGRVPEGARRFLVAYVRYDARLTAFFYFLVRRPPTRRVGPSSTVKVDVHVPECELNRWAVLGRVVLVLPALALECALGFGMMALWVVMWLSGVLAKQVPTALHQVAAIIARYRVRLNAYLLLLTAYQPWVGLYGDEHDASILTSATTNVVAFTDSTEPTTSDGSLAQSPAELTEDRSWVISHAARVLLTCTIVVGSIAAVTYGTLSALQQRVPDPPAVLNRAVLELINQADNAIHDYSVRQVSCSTVACRGQLAASTASAIDSQVASFTTNYLFPPASQRAARNYSSAVSVLASDMRVIATTKRARVQERQINLTVVTDLFVALKYEHILLFPNQVHRSSSIAKLVAAIQTLTQSYTGAVATFNADSRVCAPVGCRAQLAKVAASKIDALVTSFEANYSFPSRTRTALAAFDHSIREVARNLVLAFVVNSTATTSQQFQLFDELSNANLRTIVRTERTLIHELDARA